MMAPQTPISHIHLETAVNIAKFPPTPENMTPNNDAPDADSPNSSGNDAYDYPYADDYDAAYPKLIHLSLRNRNHNRKISSNTKKTIKRT